MAASGFNLPAPEDRLTIRCLYCQQTLEVSRRAVSMVCKFCHKPLRLEDISIKAYEARRSVETAGIVTVEKKGNFVGDKIQASGVVVRGKIKGQVISRGPVLVGPEAEIRGDVTAPAIAIGAGAILDGHYEIGTPAALPPTPSAGTNS